MWLTENFNLIYIFVVGILLFLSWLYFTRSQYDERRQKRFSKARLYRTTSRYMEKLYNQEYESFLRSYNLPLWITSIRLNILRFFIMIFVAVILLSSLIAGKLILGISELILLGMLPIILIPKKPFPLYFLVVQFKRNYVNELSNEVYQLYNDIKSNYQVRKKDISNSYYTIQYVLPYYKQIKPTLEKMLPLLANKKVDEAWDLFATEIGTRESTMLSILMKEIEVVTLEQALMLLEQKRKEFANALYDRYTDYLKKRKFIIFVFVSVCAMPVLINEISVFYMWYKETMANSTQYMQ